MKYPSLILLAVFVGSAWMAVYGTIPTDSLGEGTCTGLVPLPCDTIQDTSFHYGDTLVLGNGQICVKPFPEQREDVAIPSVKTTVRIVAGDGFARGTVTQVFRNPFELPFEATYIFPLPHDGAVHAMDFRTSYGVYHADLKEKEQAKKEYEEAKQQGLQASLLLQGQDNIFIQKLCNIPSHDSVAVKITFSMALDYDMGRFELAFPTTMIPRYDPAPMGKVKRNPTYVPSDTRHGSTLDFSILILTPYAPAKLTCPSHEVTVDGGNLEATLKALGMMELNETMPLSCNPSLMRLVARETIPNRDIVVRFERSNANRSVSCLSYHDGQEGYLAMNIYPSLIDTTNDRPQAVDMVFVVDKSGSMSGDPMAKAKEIMHCMLDKVRSDDRISFLAFNNSTDSLFSVPAPGTAENVATGRAWVDALVASGGTEMLKGVQQALQVPLSGERVRVLSLITDGAIGGVDQIYQAIRNDPSNTIVFAFGVGSSPNRELIDGAATAGNGVGRNFLLGDKVEAVVDEFWTRIRLPQISSIVIHWGNDVPSEVTKMDIPGLWMGQPILLYGKYSQPGPRTIRLTGMKNGVAVSEAYDIYLVANNAFMKSVPKMWARETIENLKHEQVAKGDESNKDKILEISLAYEVLCEYTAFLAVADSVANENGEMIACDVPIPVPQGVDPTMSGAEDGSRLVYMAYPGATGLAPGSNQGNGGLAMKVFQYQPKLVVHVQNDKARLSLVDFPTTVWAGTIAIWDVQGRLVKSWHLADLTASNFEWIWDYTNTEQQKVRHGMYFVVVRIPGLKMRKVLLYR